MRDDDDDRGRYDEDDDRPPPFPNAVLVAGIIWIGVGALNLIGTVINLLSLGANQPGGNQGAAGGAYGGVCCGGAIGIAFVVCGYQTVKGQARDTLGNSIGSMLLGLLQVLAGIAIMVFGGGGAAAAGAGGKNNALAGVGALGMVVGLFVAAMGSSLILAGILGLAGRSAYQEWKAAAAPMKRRPRRRQLEDDDEEDEEPRPRRRRVEADDDEDRDDDDRRRRR
jgi:hypothetical protein